MATEFSMIQQQNEVLHRLRPTWTVMQLLQR
uniref:Uncharacterized protein n=1 Tax=Lotus japonicus TaxID=34305 RepID=I3T8Y6_LOTJA|nr:unknown [Lotus japonicus]